MTTASTSNKSKTPVTNHKHVIVIGAGAAGLNAARHLAQRGVAVTLLEARNRIGGRTYTIQDESGNAIELGAEFVHGRPQVTLDLAQAAGAAIVEDDGEWFAAKSGKRGQSSDDVTAGVFDALEEDNGADRSFDAFLQERDLSDETRADVSRYVEGFDAADVNRVSIQWIRWSEAALASIGGEHNYHLPEGYAPLMAHLLAEATGATLCLNHVVTRITWQEGKVQVSARTPDGEKTFTADAALVTLPISVLQAGDVTFEPPLPEPKTAALAQLVMGAAFKIGLRFRERFWEEQLGFLTSDHEQIMVWWSLHPRDRNFITGWVGGPRVNALAEKSLEEVTQIALNALGEAYPEHAARLPTLLEAVFYFNWQTDAYAQGAYSYVAAGGMGAPAALAAPIGNTLFFAGEATDTRGFTGTVQGALYSGERAAMEMIAALTPDPSPSGRGE